MKSILVIGLGRFGRHLASKLNALGNEVMIIDTDESLIDELSEEFADAQICDCTSERVMQSLGVRNFDICFVCIGENFQSSLEVTALLKENGAKKVVAKANSERQARLLLKIGADEIIYAEKDMAIKTAMKYNENNIIDFIPVTEDCSIYELPVPDSWIGKSVVETNARNKYRINIIAVQNGTKINPFVSAEYVFELNDTLFVIGKSADVEKFCHKR